MATKPATPIPAEPAQLADYRPVKLAKRSNGWTAERQRKFLTVLAETGCISEACTQAGVSSRSAYRLRQRTDAQSFARAWDQALRLATVRLTTIAFERAVRGTTREIWRDDQWSRTVASRRTNCWSSCCRPVAAQRRAQPTRRVRRDGRRTAHRLPRQPGSLADHDVEMVPLETRDFYPRRRAIPMRICEAGGRRPCARACARTCEEGVGLRLFGREIAGLFPARRGVRPASPGDDRRLGRCPNRPVPSACLGKQSKGGFAAAGLDARVWRGVDPRLRPGRLRRPPAMVRASRERASLFHGTHAIWCPSRRPSKHRRD